MLKCLSIFFTLTFSASILAWNQNDDDSKNNLQLLDTVDGPSLLGDSGVVYPKWTELTAQMQRLAKDHSSWVSYIEYGQTLRGNKLTMLKIGSGVSGQAVEISGAIHGNEYLGIEHHILEEFISSREKYPGVDRFLSLGGAIYFIPVVNPDGFVARSRFNRNRKDLNRDWETAQVQYAGFKEIETKSLATYIKEDMAKTTTRLVFAMDYHCCIGGLIMPWSYKNTHLDAKQMAAFTPFTDLYKNIFNFKVGNPYDIVGYTAVGTTVDYFYNNYQTIALTHEGLNGGDFKYLQQHLDFLDQSLYLLSSSSIFW